MTAVITLDLQGPLPPGRRERQVVVQLPAGERVAGLPVVAGQVGEPVVRALGLVQLVLFPHVGEAGDLLGGTGIALADGLDQVVEAIGCDGRVLDLFRTAGDDRELEALDRERARYHQVGHAGRLVVLRVRRLDNDQLPVEEEADVTEGDEVGELGTDHDAADGGRPGTGDGLFQRQVTPARDGPDAVGDFVGELVPDVLVELFPGQGVSVSQLREPLDLLVRRHVGTRRRADSVGDGEREQLGGCGEPERRPGSTAGFLRGACYQRSSLRLSRTSPAQVLLSSC
jgi:hypothetical protein